MSRLQHEYRQPDHSMSILKSIRSNHSQTMSLKDSMRNSIAWCRALPVFLPDESIHAFIGGVRGSLSHSASFSCCLGGAALRTFRKDGEREIVMASS